MFIQLRYIRFIQHRTGGDRISMKWKERGNGCGPFIILLFYLPGRTRDTFFQEGMPLFFYKDRLLNYV